LPPSLPCYPLSLHDALPILTMTVRGAVGRIVLSTGTNKIRHVRFHQRAEHSQACCRAQGQYTFSERFTQAPEARSYQLQLLGCVLRTGYSKDALRGLRL